MSATETDIKNKPKSKEEAMFVDFNLEDVKRELDALAKKLNGNSSLSNLYFAICNAQISSNADFFVKIKALSVNDFEELERYKTRIAKALKEKLNYEFFRLELEKPETLVKEKVYNPVDKYFEVVKTHPELATLKDYFAAEIMH